MVLVQINVEIRSVNADSQCEHGFRACLHQASSSMLRQLYADASNTVLIESNEVTPDRTRIPKVWTALNRTETIKSNGLRELFKPIKNTWKYRSILIFRFLLISSALFSTFLLLIKILSTRTAGVAGDFLAEFLLWILWSFSMGFFFQ